MASVLITGITGFVGTHLADALLKQGHHISGIDRHNASAEHLTASINRYRKHIEELPPVTIYQNDLSSISDIQRIIEQENPDWIVHLAGIAFVPHGWHDPASICNSNVSVTINLLQAARDLAWKGRFLYISSSDVYGSPPPELMPLMESSVVDPDSPYSVSKYSAELFVRTFEKCGISVFIARPFNHIGPGQKENFVVPAFVKRILDAQQTKTEELVVGDLTSARDFLDVRDVVRAYITILEKGTSGEVYNICSGRKVIIRDLLDIILTESKLALKVKVDTSLLRVEGSSVRYGSSDQLKKLGWNTSYTLEESIRDVIEYQKRMMDAGS